MMILLRQVRLVHYDNTSGVIEDRLVNTNNTFVSDVFTLSVVLSDSIAFSATFNLYVKKSNLIPISYYIILLLTQRNNVIMVSIWKVQMETSEQSCMHVAPTCTERLEGPAAQSSRRSI